MPGKLTDFKVERGKLIREYDVSILDKQLTGLTNRLRDLDAQKVRVQAKIDRINNFKDELGL